jgi:hypothetical protein
MLVLTENTALMKLPPIPIYIDDFAFFLIYRLMNTCFARAQLLVYQNVAAYLYSMDPMASS